MRLEYMDCIFNKSATRCVALTNKECRYGATCNFYKSAKEWVKDPLTGYVRRKK